MAANRDDLEEMERVERTLREKAVEVERLTPGGLLALEIGHDQASQVAALLEQSGFSDISTAEDLSGIPRFPFARKP